MNFKAQESLRSMADAVRALNELNPAAAGLLMANTTKEARRIINRANQPEGMERIELIQTRGATVEMTARMIYDDNYESRSGNEHEIELYETAAGNLVLNEITQAVGADEMNRITVADAGDYLAIMDALDWGQMARTMAKKLKWSVKIEVD